MPRRLGIRPPAAAVLADYDEPALQAGQVRVRTELASTKHGTNLAIFTGPNNVDAHFDPQRHLFVPHDPAPAGEPTLRQTLNAMGAGTVTELAGDVTTWQVGDWVFGPMDIRETNVCAADGLWALGDLDPALALCVEPAYVALFSVRESLVRFGDSVAVVGLGAIGLLALRMARLSGAARLIGVDLLENRRALARTFGADEVLDPSATDVGEAVHELTGGTGVDVALEVSGSYRALQDAIRCTRVRGTVCLTGFYQGPARDVWFGREAHHNCLNLVIPHGCGWANHPRDYPMWDTARGFAVLIEMMRAGKLTAPGLISPIVTLDEAPQVWEWIAADPGRVVKFGVRF